MEDSAIREGFQKLRTGTEYDALYEAALCRERADWIVGINATRLFSCLYGQTLNVGRVMTPTLAMVVMRDAAIRAFKPEPFYSAELRFRDFQAGSERMKAKAEAGKPVAERCQAGSAIITKVEQKEKAEKPPTLFDLTSLQREANRQLGFTAQQTLDYTQALYRGFKMELSFDSFQKEYQVLLKGEMTHRVPIIINGSECEPYLTSDYRLMVERSKDIIEGISIVLKLFEKAEAIIGIEDNKPKAIDALSFECNGNNRINVMPLSTRYPQGGERRLISSVTGRQINSHILPADAGVIVLNIATIIAIYEAVKMNMPLVHRVVTLTGDGINEPGNMDVPLGISHKYLADECGGIKDSTVKIISGGPMMGMAMNSLDYPVIKTSSSILAITHDDVEKMETSACIRCGRCVAACPETLVPQLMAQAVINKNYHPGIAPVSAAAC